MAVADLLRDVSIPRMVPVRQIFDSTHLTREEIPVVVRGQLLQDKIRTHIRPGMEIAITVGSRGIANIPIIIRAIADTIRECGATPFAIPAMGSHGGATAEGQRKIIEGYGVTEKFIGCEIRSSMETVEIGTTENGRKVRIDANAYHADGIVVCGRIKAHTDFRGPYESGLMKMMAIGLGKQFGASMVHADGFGHMGEYIPLYGKAIIRQAPVLCGLGILENAGHETRELVGLTPQEIIDEEPGLLLRAKSYMARILFDSCDVLIVDEIGKNHSGDGMDPNVTGRFMSPYATGGIKAQRVAVLDLADASHGNFCGIGLADATTRRTFEKSDAEETYPNAITSTLVNGMMMPMVMNSDELAIKLCIRTCVEIDKKHIRMIRISNTTDLEHIQISEGLLKEAEENQAIEILGESREMPFDPNGNLF